MKRRVTCVFGDFNDDDSDFVLEPACQKECNCDVCKDAFWIEEVKND